MTVIANVAAWEALDSRGDPTVACEVRLRCGARGECRVPAGASTGRHEARELRDGDARYAGRGVLHAVANVNGELADAVRGMDAGEQRSVDAALRAADGTPGLARLGANAVLAVSIATALAAADAYGVPLYRMLADAPAVLPMPMVNVISGGAHASGGIDIQDVLVIPLGATTFAEAIEWASRVRRGTAEALESRGVRASLVADEGGLGPVLDSNRAALEFVTEGIERAGLAPGTQAAIAIDVAATQLLRPDGTYALRADGGSLGASELVERLSDWCDAFPIVSLEDPVGEDDERGWRDVSSALGSRVQLLGDDLFATNEDRLVRGIEDGVANGLIVKPNQVGTLSAAGDVVSVARRAGYTTVVSARSGETEDHWLADLAVGWQAGQIKVGSTSRSERTAKWNRLLKIEAELGAVGATLARYPQR